MMRFLSILYPVLFTLILLASMNLARQHLPRLAKPVQDRANRTAPASARTPAPAAAPTTAALARTQDNATATLPGYVLNPVQPPRAAVDLPDKASELRSYDPARLAPLLNQVSREFNVPATLLWAIAKQESSHNPWAVNMDGRGFLPRTKQEALFALHLAKPQSFDLGMMQVNSFWLRKYRLKPSDVLEPEINVRLGAFIMRDCLDRHGLTWKAIGAYHTGDPDRHAWRAYNYAKQVLAHYQKLKAQSATAQAPAPSTAPGK